MVLPCSVVAMSTDTLLENTNYPLPSRYQFQIASWLGVGISHMAWYLLAVLSLMVRDPQVYTCLCLPRRVSSIMPSFDFDFFFFCILELELVSLCLHSNYFPYWAISQSLFKSFLQAKWSNVVELYMNQITGYCSNFNSMNILIYIQNYPFQYYVHSLEAYTVSMSLLN